MIMKKIFLFLAVASLAVSSCRKDDDPVATPEVSIETQNTYDDDAIQKFLADNYLDTKGNIVAFDSSITTDDNEKPLSSLNPVKLPSGVVYISIYTPTNGKAIADKDKIRLMHKTMTYVATKDDKNVTNFGSAVLFRNTISGSGTPEIDPAYFYVKESVLKKYNENLTTPRTRSFFEIEGLQEALKMFKSCEISDEEYYNLQGIIIVPSRAAFARDDHFPYTTFALRNRSLVFNFQVYKTETRTSAND